MAKLRAGSRLGVWTLDTRIGKGGNGVVWECHNDDGTRAALKVLKSDLLESTQNLDEKSRRSKRTKRFIDEIQFLRTCQVNGIIPLLDSYLPDDPNTSNQPWLVMPVGESLPDYISNNGRMLTDLVRIFRILTETLSALHTEGSAHRDIKPENIIIVDRVPFLSDFGLVHFDQKDPNTSECEILGPLFFVAPEMMGNASGIDARPADIYSLAKSFWVAASAQRFPLPGEQRIGIPALSLSAYVNDQRAKLLDKLVDACTRHSPQERPTADEMCQELTAWSRSETAAQGSILAVTEIARSLTSTVARTKSEFELRRQMCAWGTELMNAAASLLPPLVDALSSFGFTDHEGRPLPARLIQGEGNPMWDQWTYPNALVDETGDVVWRGAAGTIAEFVQAKGPAVLLISGIRILVRADQSVTFCAAHVCIVDGGRNTSQIVWRADATSEVGTAAADAALRSLLSQLLAEAPKATEAFTTAIERVIAM